MFFGPLLTRQLVTAPRRKRLYVMRAAYPAGLLLVAATSYLVLAGAHPIRGAGDLARFGGLVFQLLSALQLALAIFFSATVAAIAVSLEKDRRTLDLLLVTDLTSTELVLGKLLGSLLPIFVTTATGLPVFALLSLLGGVSAGQIARMTAVTLATILVAGSIGTTLALWREKTFQSLALAALVLGAWLGLGEVVAAGLLGETWLGLPTRQWSEATSPWRALLVALSPVLDKDALMAGFPTSLAAFLAVAFTAVVGLCAIGIARARAWNLGTSGTAALFTQQERTELLEPAARRPTRSTLTQLSPAREVWDNPVLWREIATWAHGRRIVLVRAAYILLFAAAAWATHQLLINPHSATRPALAVPLAPLLVSSLMLVNALSVTSITTERDGGAFDLLLVTDLTPREIVLGKLAGALWNAKEVIVLPLALCVYLWSAGATSLENLIYLVGTFAVLDIFAATLGLHCGLIYPSSRLAIAVSLGTLFFLLVGVATCIAILVAFSDPTGGSFAAQLAPFLALVVGGSAGLYFALGARSPSSAIGWAAFLAPPATFWAITSFFLDFTLGIFLVTAATYGFTTLAMLIPAISEADLRAALDE